MKLFHMQVSPNARRVRIFLAEKQISLEVEECLDPQRMCLKEEFLTLYPFRLVPMLLLDDGTQIGESTAICRYLEELYPEPNLFGRDALEKAMIEMWQQRANNDGELGAEEVFRNSFVPFANRGLAGSADPIPQIPALVERGKGRLARFFAMLDAQLQKHPFVAGNRFSVADITALCAIDFAKATGATLPDAAASLRRWYEAVGTRSSASA
jgi:glutathione S-transferase